MEKIREGLNSFVTVRNERIVGGYITAEWVRITMLSGKEFQEMVLDEGVYWVCRRYLSRELILVRLSQV